MLKSDAGDIVRELAQDVLEEDRHKVGDTVTGKKGYFRGAIGKVTDVTDNGLNQVVSVRWHSTGPRKGLKPQTSYHYHDELDKVSK